MSASSGTTVLVTGGFGAIGSWVVRRLVSEGKKVAVYSRREDYSLVPELRGVVAHYAGDVLDRKRLEEAVRESGARRTIHLAAALTGVCERDPVLGYQVNLMGGINVFDVARALELERVVFASSKAAYGDVEAGGEPGKPILVTEDKSAETMKVYGATKRALEDAAKHYKRLWGLEIVAIRLGSTFGPGKLRPDYSTGYTGLKDRIIFAGLRGDAFTVPHPDLADDVVYNPDAAQGFVLACFAEHLEHTLFNISGGRLITLREISQEVMRLCPGHRLALDESGKAEERRNVLHGLLSIERARRELGYQPDFPGAAGVAHYIDHVRGSRGSRG